MNSDFLTQHCRWILATGITIGIILSFAFAHHQIITGDQWQMLQKGYLAAHEVFGLLTEMPQVLSAMCPVIYQHW